MNDKKLRKIGKKELLEILLSQAKRIEELELELEDTKKKLESKKILIEESGSLAEASLKLNNIFEVAQQAADQYLLNVKEKCKKIENDVRKTCQIKKNKIIKETEKVCKQKKQEKQEKKEKIGKEIKKNNTPKNVVADKSKKVLVVD